MTFDEFKSDYPDIYKTASDEGKQAGIVEGKATGYDEGLTKGKAEGVITGAETERKRIQGVEDQLIPGHEALIQELKFDGQTTGEQAAVKVLQAEKTLRSQKLSDLDDDAAKAVADAKTSETETLEEDKKSFETLVSEYKKEKKCSDGAAISAIAKEYPDQHAEYLKKVNQKGGK